MNLNFKETLKKGRHGETLSREEIVRLLAASPGEEQTALHQAADQVRHEVVGDQVHLRGIIEFSNYCIRDCHYCGLRASNPENRRYRMPLEEIFDIAQKAWAIGYRTLVLQSGEDPWYDARDFAQLVRRIKEELGVAITLSLGERDYEDYAVLREAGADRYLLKHETSNPALFEQLRPGTKFEDRARCLRQLKELGFQVGSGNMVGLPGQTLEMLADDILFMRDLEVDMAGIGPLIPHPSTPLAGLPAGDLELVLNCVAVARLVIREVHLPATTATGTVNPMGRQRALQAGANVVMPNVTPNEYRRRYEIYPNKICLDDEPGHCRNCISGIILSLNRTVADDPGHSPRLTR